MWVLMVDWLMLRLICADENPPDSTTLAKTLKKMGKLKKEASKSETKYWILMYRLNF